ncbi:ABC transporter permease [Brevibacillus dissolubilis]|uniref:ABC transporter permease n=1 Tax=Brevibacillus dissolubilis TaxID=1844116 RepID=UPI001116F033|nr:ABC transporter permease subunit [Brevibacillus dissolubilis]
MTDFFTNPLIVKEMRERFRTPKTFWILGLYLLVMGAILLGFIFIQQMNSYISPGDNSELFVMLAVIQYGMICFIAPALSAGAISGERERQTLNILLTTHLSPAKIIMSKIVTSLAFIFLLVVTSLPLYSFVILYGGISPTQLLLLLLFFSVNIICFGSIGLFCSTWMKRTGVSTITAYGLSFFLVVGTGLVFIFLGMLIQQMYPEVYVDETVWNLLGIKLLAGMNPPYVLSEILGENIGPKLDWFMPVWAYFSIIYGVLSLILIAGSAYLLRPVRRTWFAWKK